MTDEPRSDYEWRRKRGGFNRAFERLSDLPADVFTPRRALVTDAAKRKLYEEGIAGQATIVKAPGLRSVSAVNANNLGRFVARVEASGTEPYEVKVWQSFTKTEWEGLRPRSLVDCRIDRGDPKRVLLLAPESSERSLKVEDSADLLASGKRAVATVLESADLEKSAPGSGDPMYVLRLDVRAADEPERWTVRFGQRVPQGALELIEPGSELQVAYRAIRDDSAVAVDWPATTGGRFS